MKTTIKKSQTTIHEQPRTWMNTKQCADYLMVSISTVERFKAHHGLPHSKVAQTSRFNRDAVDQWLLEHERKNPLEV